MYIGRYQIGQVVPISVVTTDASDNPSDPDDVPIARIYRGSTFVASVRMSVRDRFSQRAYFDHQLKLMGGAYQAGYHTVIYTYTVSGSTITKQSCFQVVPGGDEGGTVISMTTYKRPEAQSVVAQLTSGRLVFGRGPTI